MRRVLERGDSRPPTSQAVADGRDAGKGERRSVSPDRFGGNSLGKDTVVGRASRPREWASPEARAHSFIVNARKSRNARLPSRGETGASRPRDSPVASTRALARPPPRVKPGTAIG